MKPKYFLIGIGILLVFLMGGQFLDLSQVNEATYLDKVEKIRADKDKMFQSGKESPLIKADKSKFQGLNYFPIDEKFKVSGKFIKSPFPKKVFVNTSSGDNRSYLVLGKFTFSIDDQPYSLTLFSGEDELGQSYNFLPFTDATTGVTTYESGRYIDDVLIKDDLVYVDFNLAYNPYCAYNPKFDCPIPPAENHLLVEVAAGEKKYK